MEDYRVLNIWTSDKKRLNYIYYLGKPVYTNGEYAIYNCNTYHLYTYKNIGINQLVGLNIEHLDNVANGNKVTLYPDKLFYDRAIEAIKKGKDILGIK